MSTSKSQPPFGRITWKPEDYLSYWTGSITINSFSKCRVKWNEVGKELDDYQPTCEFEFLIYATHLDTGKFGENEIPPYPEQVKAFEYFVANEKEITKLTLEKMASWFTEYHGCYWQDSGASQQLIEHAGTFNGIQETIRVGSVYFNNKSTDGYAYVGITFDCPWEIEHGVGILLHKNRIVDIGGNDMAYNYSMWTDEYTPES